MNEWEKRLVLQSIVDMLGDSRLVYFQTNIVGSRPSILSGEVDTRETYDRVCDQLNNQTAHAVVPQLQILHEQVHPDARFGMVVVPVCDMRKDGRFRSDRVHQLIFGQWVQVLRMSTDYLMVKDCVHGYLGYVHIRNLDLCHQDRHDEIVSLPHWLVKSRFACANRIQSSEPAIMHPMEYDGGWLPLGAHVYTDMHGRKTIDAMLPSATVSVFAEDCQPFHQRPIQQIVDMALPLYTRVPYLWGGCSTYGTDCSGFVMRLFEMSGRTIPRDADQQEAFLEGVSLDIAQLGDLCFFPGHVGLYLGEGWMIHANVTLGGVTINQILRPRDSYEQHLRKSLSMVGRWLDQTS